MWPSVHQAGPCGHVACYSRASSSSSTGSTFREPSEGKWMPCSKAFARGTAWIGTVSLWVRSGYCGAKSDAGSDGDVSPRSFLPPSADPRLVDTVCKSTAPEVFDSSCNCGREECCPAFATDAALGCVSSPAFLLVFALQFCDASCASTTPEVFDSFGSSCNFGHEECCPASATDAVLGGVSSPPFLLVFPLRFFDTVCTSATPDVFVSFGSSCNLGREECCPASATDAVLAGVSSPPFLVVFALQFCDASCASTTPEVFDSFGSSCNFGREECCPASATDAVLGGVSSPPFLLVFPLRFFDTVCTSATPEVFDSFRSSCNFGREECCPASATDAVLGGVSFPPFLLVFPLRFFDTVCTSATPDVFDFLGSSCNSGIAVCCLGGTNDAVLGCISSPLLPFFPRFVDTVSFVCPEVLWPDPLWESASRTIEMPSILHGSEIASFTSALEKSSTRGCAPSCPCGFTYSGDDGAVDAADAVRGWEASTDINVPLGAVGTVGTSRSFFIPA